MQVDEKPGIRANTTVLLGNIARYLGDAACKRVLLNAFTRALKDAFPPARIAALKVSGLSHCLNAPSPHCTPVASFCYHWWEGAAEWRVAVFISEFNRFLFFLFFFGGGGGGYSPSYNIS
jgi:hypothetical protein